MTRLFFLFYFAFLQPSTGFQSIIATKPVPTRLQYQDDKHSEQSTQKPATLPTLPVMGPFLNQPSLMIGAEMTLQTPTPLQWQSLEESFYRHQQHLEADDDSSGISEAPLVAILDQTNDMSQPGSQGRYATIAAVVGVSTGSIDATDDNSAFMESIAGNRAMIDTAKVRLVGVGRAVLKEFLYQVPTRLAQIMDEEGHWLTSSEDDDDDEPPVHVIVAQFSLINDILSNPAVSPTHAVTKMGRLANQVEWLHQDRRNLVAGIKAAKARLEKAADKKLLEFEDHDGLGLLFGEAVQEEFELEKPKKKSKTKKKKLRSPAEEKDRDSSNRLSKASDNKPDDMSSSLSIMENYGLGSSASSLTGLKEMTQVLLEKLAPYYSPQRCASEEHYYEVYSFVAVLATDPYVKSSDLSWSLRCVNTEQRLQRTYGWMAAHVGELKKEADRVSRALHECGEECTDLF